MPGLGSISEGMIGMQLDLQNIQLNQAKIAEAPIKLDEERIELKKQQIGLDQQVKMLSLMQNFRPPADVNSADGISSVLSQISMWQLESGQPDAAAKTAAEAYRIQDAASKIDYRTYKMQNDRLEKFANVLSMTPDSPQGWAQAIQTISAEDPGAQRDPKFQALAKQPWKPGMVPLIQQSVLTAKSKAEIDYRKKAGDHAEAAAKVDEHRVGLIDAQTIREKQRIKAGEKAGVSAVKAGQLKSITDMAETDYPGADPADLRVRSRPLAEEMVKMVREQHLTESEAARRVYERAKANGVFTGIRLTPVQKGSKPEAPLIIPENAKSVKDLKQNQWYMFNGVPKVVMGTKAYSQEELKELDDEDRDLLSDEDEEPAP